MAIHIRRLSDADLPSAMQTFSTAMQLPPLTGEAWEAAQDRGYPERSFAAFDADVMVGHTRSIPFVTLVPGGRRLATAGITAVGTLPTHRRQGILSRLMQTQLLDCAEKDEPLASLRASEAVIYGRFGYGMAAHAMQLEIPSHRARFTERVPDDGSFRYARGPQLLDLLPELQARCLRRPGQMERPRPLWKRMLGPLVAESPAESRWLVLHLDRRGRPDGYVEWEARWDQRAVERTLFARVGDLLGVSDHVEALLWQFMFDLDLVTRVEVDARPLDDPLRWRLADPRAVLVKDVWDEQWLRIVDVAAALEARSFNDVSSSVVVEVSDPILPQNDGRYELSPAGARRVRRAADLEVPISALGAIYLGGTSVTALTTAGRIRERRRGAATRADLLLHSTVAPWCGTFF